MKATSKILLFSFILCCLTFIAQAQTAADLFSRSTEITWLGLDFSAARFAGDHDAWKDKAHVREVIQSLNNLMVKERDKYEIASAIDKSSVDYQVDVTMTHNDNLDLNEILTDKSTGLSLRASDIQNIVKKYNFNGLKGIGLMFNVEQFNKPLVQSVIWVTFIDMSTKQVVMTEKVTQAPVGFGIRNYWAGAIGRTIKDIRSTEYERWRKKNTRKGS